MRGVVSEEGREIAGTGELTLSMTGKYRYYQNISFDYVFLTLLFFFLQKTYRLPPPIDRSNFTIMTHVFFNFNHSSNCYSYSKTSIAL